VPKLSDANVEVDEQRTKQPAQCTCTATQHSHAEVLEAPSIPLKVMPPLKRQRALLCLCLPVSLASRRLAGFWLAPGWLANSSELAVLPTHRHSRTEAHPRRDRTCDCHKTRSCHCTALQYRVEAKGDVQAGRRGRRCNLVK
jgi:hypothetical protein